MEKQSRCLSNASGQSASVPQAWALSLDVYSNWCSLLSVAQSGCRAAGKAHSCLAFKASSLFPHVAPTTFWTDQGVFIMLFSYRLFCVAQPLLRGSCTC